MPGGMALLERPVSHVHEYGEGENDSRETAEVEFGVVVEPDSANGFVFAEDSFEFEQHRGVTRMSGGGGVGGRQQPTAQALEIEGLRVGERPRLKVVSAEELL